MDKPSVVQIRRSNGSLAWVNYETIICMEKRTATRTDELIIYLSDGSELACEDSAENLTKILASFEVV
ncbi:MAG: hypothetical protein AABZ60_01805 [Planctomycetota bacterium]